MSATGGKPWPHPAEESGNNVRLTKIVEKFLQIDRLLLYLIHGWWLDQGLGRHSQKRTPW